MSGRSERHGLRCSPVWLMVATNLLVSGVGYADGSAPSLSLWRAVEHRTLSDSVGKDRSVAASIAESFSRRCDRELDARQRDVRRYDMELSQLTSATAAINGSRSVLTSDRRSNQMVSIANYRISMWGPWGGLGHDRGWLSSNRQTTRIIDPDRYETEDWSARRQLRSGHPQADVEIEHEITVWERQGPCPPGVGPGFVTDKEMDKAAGEPPPVVVPRP